MDSTGRPRGHTDTCPKLKYGFTTGNSCAQNPGAHKFDFWKSENFAKNPEQLRKNFFLCFSFVIPKIKFFLCTDPPLGPNTILVAAIPNFFQILLKHNSTECSGIILENALRPLFRELLRFGQRNLKFRASYANFQDSIDGRKTLNLQCLRTHCTITRVLWIYWLDTNEKRNCGCQIRDPRLISGNTYRLLSEIQKVVHKTCFPKILDRLNTGGSIIFCHFDIPPAFLCSSGTTHLKIRNISAGEVAVTIQSAFGLRRHDRRDSTSVHDFQMKLCFRTNSWVPISSTLLTNNFNGKKQSGSRDRWAIFMCFCSNEHKF